MELFLTLKLYLHLTELFSIKFWHLTVGKENPYLYLYWTELAELELFD